MTRRLTPLTPLLLLTLTACGDDAPDGPPPVSVPTITSTGPTAASEAAAYIYAVTCASVGAAPPTLALDPADTSCPGASLTQDAPGQATVTFTPGEADGGTTCALSLSCSNGASITFELVTVTIAEANDPPSLTNLPAAATAMVGRAGAFTATASDTDLPAQALTFSLASTACSFPVTVGVDGAVSFTCGAAVESCAAKLRVSDGVDSGEAALSIGCTNAPPSVTGVAISPATAYRNTPLTCSYSFSDPDGDADQSTIAWFVNDAPAGAGPTLASGYAAGDTVRCEVTPSDGVPLAPISAQITIGNRAPSATSVAISPAAITQAGEPLTCAYTFADPDGDADSSTIAWLVNGVAVGAGATFSTYLPGDSVACRVTPNDGTTSGGAATSPTLVAPDWRAVSASGSYTCAIQRDALYCWGDRSFSVFTNPANITPVTQIAGLTSDVTAVATSSTHACAVQAGALKCWGTNSAGQLGDGSTTTSTSPTQVIGLTSGVTAVATGSAHTCAIQAGALKCWGANNSGQLGNGMTTNATVPVQVTELTSGVTAVAAGSGYTCAIHSGALKCWGANSSGQLGDGTIIRRTAPTQVTGMETGASAIAAGLGSACAVQGGALKCWGDNFNGQLGDGTATGRITPAQVVGLTAGVSLVSIVPSRGGAIVVHKCAIQSGALKCWGSNGLGQLGDGTTTGRLTPVATTAMTADVTALSVGDLHTCAIRRGALYCWGANFNGQLGDGTTTQRNTPGLVSIP
jgi:alpha-tubulin suppressor-like RCC1 family protein